MYDLEEYQLSINTKNNKAAGMDFKWISNVLIWVSEEKENLICPEIKPKCGKYNKSLDIMEPRKITLRCKKKSEFEIPRKFTRFMTFAHPSYAFFYHCPVIVRRGKQPILTNIF
ncbi:hypothetical protein AVEN_119761-1 [Araneus ventricosus]|uniref:Uncharacterized protein n=1 Tax=Araneus ventricosus TaxID=182803 RepID=A0A4Y2FC01_ARAVE|nr:hypothetical protein AVEN_119761-1 [Araneus ventricosus]